MEMTGTVRIFTRLSHSSSVLDKKFYCAFKREYKHRRQATREYNFYNLSGSHTFAFGSKFGNDNGENELYCRKHKILFI
jgi:hypothetical protein